MKMQFLGCGDAFGTGGRFNTCFRVGHSGGAFLIDFGASSMVALRQRGVDPDSIDAIFITHLHGDHFGGLPFFVMDARYISRRRKPLVIVGPPGIGERLAALWEVLYPGDPAAENGFLLDIRELSPGATIELNGVTATAVEMAHDSGAPSLGLRFRADSRTIAYTGDTTWTDAILDLARDVDVLILECTSFEAATDMHLTYAQIRANRHRIDARRIVLTHFGPDMYANRHRAEEELAEDGKVIEI